MNWRLRTLAVCCAAVCAAGAIGAGSALSAGASRAHPASTVHRGGSLTVAVVDSQWPGLEPSAGTEDSADVDYNNAIYGQLFAEGPHGEIIDDLATGYSFSDHNKAVTITIRKGVKFSNGDPFNASVVKWNLEQDLAPQSHAITTKEDLGLVTSISTHGDALTLHMSRAFAPIVEAFVGDAPDWIADPVAIAKEGMSAYEQDPIGAGPFEVVSNVENSSLVLKANPHYWQKGHPYLQRLTFLSVGSPQSALAALQTGQAQVISGIADLPDLRSARSDGFALTGVAGLIANTIELNTKAPPFNNIVAREAVSYATNSPALKKFEVGNYGVLTQSPQGPGGLYFEKSVPGYRTYDLKKARALVSRLGGLHTTLQVLNNPPAELLGEAIEQEWKAAGISVTLEPVSLQEDIQAFVNDSWQAGTGAAGGIEPQIGVQGLGTRVSSKGGFSGTHDPVLDGMLSKAAGFVNPATQRRDYKKIYHYIAVHAYTIYLYAAQQVLVSKSGVQNLAPTPGEVTPVVQWYNVYTS